jgi:leucyl aminopeptidase
LKQNLDFIPCRPLEFHFYAYEEVSIAGSDNVATHYANAGKRVLAMLNLDQSEVVMGLQYPDAEGQPKVPTMGLNDFTDPVAQALLIECIVLYTDIPREHIEEAPCGRACTDQASWKFNGYSSADAFEGSNPDTFQGFDGVNPGGSFSDVFENIDFVHLNRFVRQSIGFIIELSLAS